MRLKHVGLSFVLGGALMTMCQGCTQLQSALGIAPTQTQIANCATWIKQQADSKALPSAQLTADLSQLQANPPTIPSDCNGHT
jgi:hypothetical protein